MPLASRSLSPRCGGESEIEGLGERKPPKLQISQVRGSVPLAPETKKPAPFRMPVSSRMRWIDYFVALPGWTGWRTWRHSFSRRCRTWAGMVAGAVVLVVVFVCISSLLGFGSIALQTCLWAAKFHSVKPL